MTRARSVFERRLSMLADVGRGKVRCGWDADDKPVVYVASENATAAQRATLRELHQDDLILINEKGQYELTRSGRTHLNIHYPTWK